MKHLSLLISVLVLTVFGLFVAGLDVYHNKQLHAMNALVGGGSLLLAIALALPIQMKTAIDTLTPFLDRLRPPVK